MLVSETRSHILFWPVPSPVFWKFLEISRIFNRPWLNLYEIGHLEDVANATITNPLHIIHLGYWKKVFWFKPIFRFGVHCLWRRNFPLVISWNSIISWALLRKPFGTKPLSTNYVAPGGSFFKGPVEGLY